MLEQCAFRSSRVDPDWQLPLRRGAVVAPFVRDAQLVEICLLPFVFVVPEPRMAWEPRSILRIGPCLDRVDQDAALLPVVSLLSGCSVQVRESRTFYDPLVRRAFREFDLVIGLDRRSLDAVAAVLPLPAADSLASLEDDVPWRAAYGRTLRPLESWWPGGTQARCCALRNCALIAFVLSKCASCADHCGSLPLDYLLASRAALYEESSWKPPGVGDGALSGRDASMCVAGTGSPHTD